MKTARVWFILFLALLLPARSVLAAAMLCPVGSSGNQTELVLTGHAAGHHHATAARDSESTVSTHGHTGHADDEHGATHADKCDVCSAFCSVTPLLSTWASVAAPQDLSAVAFPDLTTPSPTFLSEGPERPPRSI